MTFPIDASGADALIDKNAQGVSKFVRQIK